MFLKKPGPDTAVRNPTVLSIVIPVREAADTVRATLLSLLPQCDPGKVEVIAAVWCGDPARPVLEEFAGEILRLIVVPARSGVPQLRRDAVSAAGSPWVAITEDHCLFHDRWVSTLIASLTPGSREILGGPVSNAHRSLLGWALYFNRYSGFLPPAQFSSAARGDSNFLLERHRSVRKLPGNSACYPREALTACMEIWREGFWEVEVNGWLADAGYCFCSLPGLQVAQNQRRGFVEYTRLRFKHARIFGARRAELLTPFSRFLAVLGAPLAPLVLHVRAARAVLPQKAYRAEFLLSSPLLALYYGAWALGEACGYAWGIEAAETESD